MTVHLLISESSILALTGVLTLGSTLSHAAAVPDLAAMAQANNAFAADLYGKLKSAEGNLLFSPYSIHVAFGMAGAGAGGNTAAQIGKVLHLDGTPAEAAVGQGALQQSLTSIQAKGHVKLAIANSIWPEQSYPFRKDYLSLLDEHFKVSVSPCDFKGRPNAERQRINQWVENQTNDKIKDLLPEGSVTPLTRLVLANAVYFKGDWEKPFKARATQTAPFFLGSGGELQVPLMTQKASFRYAEHPGFKVLAMPYAGGDLSMVVLLPQAMDGLPNLEQQFSAGNLGQWTAALSTTEVTVHFPRFKVSSSFELNQTMVALGMRDAFDVRQADFSRMSDANDLFLSTAVHQAFIEVNEQGTEAAAATGIVMAGRAALPKPPMVFRADHPFLYLIRHEATGAILFLGRMTDPTK